MKTIKIPRVTTSTIRLYCNISDIIDFGGKGYEVTLKSQTVAGYKIPHGTRFFTDVMPSNHLGVIVADAERVNKLLKMLYLNDLRNSKQ